MAACWLAVPFSICESPARVPISIASNAPAPVERFECEESAIEAELPLPTESEIIGIEFSLFEPLPAPKKTIRKAANEIKKELNEKKVQNKR